MNDDIKCKKCLDNFNCDIEYIRKNNKYILVECCSISFEGHICLEGVVIGYLNYQGNLITSSAKEEIKLLACSLPNKNTLNEVTLLSGKLSSFNIK